MVVSRSDSKKRKKSDTDSLQECPKRTKVHAQRKFAQGSHLNSPVLTPVKDRDKAKINGTAPLAELLPIKRPKTEEFVSFLCLRGSDLLPKSLAFFNEPSVLEVKRNDPKRDSFSSTSKGIGRGSDKHTDQAGVVKAEAKSKSKPKTVAAVEALKKKYQEQRLAKEKKSLTKLAQKVKGKSVMRTRSAGPLEEAMALIVDKRTQLNKSKGPANRKAGAIKQSPPNNRPAKSATRGGLRSGGELPPGSELGLKTERKARRVAILKASTPTKKVKKPVIASSLSDFSSDDEKPLVKKTKTSSVISPRITTRSRSSVNTCAPQSQRPTRKTKEAATIFMEMLGKDLRSPEEEEDDNIDSMSIESFIEVPNSKQIEIREKEFKDLAEQNKLKEKNKLKTTKKDNQVTSKKKEDTNTKLSNKPSVMTNSIKSRTLTRNSRRLRVKEVEIKHLQSSRKKRVMNQVLSKSSSKEEDPHEDIMESTSSAVIGTEKRKEKRPLSTNTIKKSESKIKKQKSTESMTSIIKLEKQKIDADSLFNESDEEPLGLKINQGLKTFSLRPLRKNKHCNKNIDVTTETISDEFTKLSEMKQTKMKNTVGIDEKEAISRPEHDEMAKTISDTEVKPLKQKTTKKETSSHNVAIKAFRAEPKTKITSSVEVDNKFLLKEQNTEMSSNKSSLKVVKSSTVSNKKITNKANKQESPTKPSFEPDIECTLVKVHKDVSEHQCIDISYPTDEYLNNRRELEEKKLTNKSEIIATVKDIHKESSITKKGGTETKTESFQYENIIDSSLLRDSKHMLDIDTVRSADMSINNSKENIVQLDQNTSKTVGLHSETNSLNDTVIDLVKNSNHQQSKDNILCSHEKEFIKMDTKKSVVTTCAEEVFQDKIDETITKELFTDKIKASHEKISVNQSLTSTNGSVVNSQPAHLLDNANRINLSANKIQLDSSSQVHLRLNVDQIPDGNQELIISTDADKTANPEDSDIIKETSVVNPVTSNKPERLEVCKVSEFEITTSINTPLNCALETSDIDKSIHNLSPDRNASAFTVVNCNKNLTQRTCEKSNNISTVPPDLNVSAGSASQTSGSYRVDSIPLLQVVGFQQNCADIKAVLSTNSYPLVSNTESFSDQPPKDAWQCLDPLTNLEQDNKKTGEFNGQQIVTQPKPDQSLITNKWQCSDPLTNFEQDNQKTGEFNGRQILTQPKPDQSLITNIVQHVAKEFETEESQHKLLGKAPVQWKSDSMNLPTKRDVFCENKKLTEFNCMSSTSSQDVKPNEFGVSCRNEDNYISTGIKMDSLEMSAKVSSAIDTLMSLKNVQKLDSKCIPLPQPGHLEFKQTFKYDAKPIQMLEFNQINNDSRKFKYQDVNIKSIQIPDLKHGLMLEHSVQRIAEVDCKNMTLQEPDMKRVTIQEPEFKRGQTLEYKTKPTPSHVLKGCLNPKSMLKPGTLIDIAGISHSPEIMTPLRPGSDGEIIPMNRPLMPDPSHVYKAPLKPYDPRPDSTFFGHIRWQPVASERTILKSDQHIEKDSIDSKFKLPVNESAWRQAFKNVREPKATSNSPTEKPKMKKQPLSVTTLARRHSKSKSEGPIPTAIHSKPAIPFLRQNKPFLGLVSPSKKSIHGNTYSTPEAKKATTDIDLNSLREKEAEVEEFLREYVSGGMSRTFKPIQNQIGGDVLSERKKSPVTLDQGHMTHTSFNLSEPTNALSVQLEREYEAALNRQSSFDTINARSNSPSRNSLNISSEETTLSLTSDTNRHYFTECNIKSNDPKLSNETTKQEPAFKIIQQDTVKTSDSPTFQNLKSTELSDVGSSKLSQMAYKFCISSPKNNYKECKPLSTETSNSVTPTHQLNVGDNLFKQVQPGRRLNSSPTRSLPYTSSSCDNLFNYCSSPKRTNSPTYPSSYSRGASPNKLIQEGYLVRKCNSPVQLKNSKSVFKDTGSPKSYSSTSSACQGDIDSTNKLFSSNLKFKRSISPLCNNKIEISHTTAVLEMYDNADVKISNSINLKSQNSGFEDNSKHQTRSIKIEKAIFHDDPSKPIDETLMTQTSNLGEYEKSLVQKDIVIKEEVLYDQVKSIFPLNICTQDTKTDLKQEEIDMSEAKHCLPVLVDQTLKKLSQRCSPNKKLNSKRIESGKIVSKPNKVASNIITQANTTDVYKNVLPNIQTTGIYSHSPEGELDLMAKKKVNMSSEEINRWLNDSSSSPILEHREGCTVLENNICECEYSSTLSKHKANSLKQDCSMVTVDVQSEKIVTEQIGLANYKETKSDTFKLTHPILEASKAPISTKKQESNKDRNIILKDIKDMTNNDVLLKLESDFSNDTTMKERLECEKLAPNKLHKVSLPPLQISNQSKELDNTNSHLELSLTPPKSKGTAFKLSQKNTETEQLAKIVDASEVILPHLRDDMSSSNDVSSSNEETPEKTISHERRSIFHQRRSTLKVKERRELIAPSVNAFSPENESSVYAFEPDLPPASTPFRRSKGKEGRFTNTTADEEEVAPSSNSIAVQVNFDNEAVLECSTQTDVQEGDDDDMHTFYIPLQQSSTDTSKPPLIQGVAVKVDTEGPDQKVIMRAKLVTKPLSTFSRTSSTPARALMASRSGKPQQKVRPLSVKPPVGTVQPTARPKPLLQTEVPSPSTSKSFSPQAVRLAKRTKAKGEMGPVSVETPPVKPPFTPKLTTAKLVEAPTFYPTETEFEDPLEYIASITPQAEKFGLCRVVPPSNFKPECKVSDDMRFTAYNQYIHKMLHRWGPNVKEMLAIKKYLATQSIALTQPPWIGGMEVDLPRLYQTVQQCGGLKEVIEKKRWQRVADTMKIPRSAQDRVTKLDDIYCKFLLPYDTLSHVERTQLFEDVEKDWVEREKRANSQDDHDDDNDEDNEDSDSDSEIDECIVKGRSMALNAFYRIARNTMSMWFSKTDNPPAGEVELEFWKHVASRQHHVCVHSGSIDTGAIGYGFPTGKNSSTSRHPWNLKVLTNNPGSVLRYLGPLMGVTVPTLHVGMLFSACCWYRDPHGLPWVEYLHTGASKIWYGIPDSSSELFRSAVMDLVPRLCRDQKLWLASDTAMVPPPLLVERGVSLSRIVQDPGQFIIVFPKAFTSSTCTGYVVSESVYFAQPSWLATALNLFNDMRESCEPTVFSLDKLLFSIVNDSRSSIEVLNQILPIVVSLRDGEIAGRRQLEELGLHSSERLNTKRRKSRPANEEEEEYECDDCRTNLFISFVSNSHDNTVYCLPHAVELLTHKRSQVKYCNLLYAFSEDELEDLVEKLKSRVENRSHKKVQMKSSKS